MYKGQFIVEIYKIRKHQTEVDNAILVRVSESLIGT